MVSEDRVITRLLAFDLTLTGPAYRRKSRTENKKRQKIVRFHEKRDNIEYFELRQTTPYCGYESFCPLSQRQYDAVMNYYSKSSETRYQASMMLTARDYAKAVSDKHTLSAVGVNSSLFAPRPSSSRIKSCGQWFIHGTSDIVTNAPLAVPVRTNGATNGSPDFLMTSLQT